MIMQLLPDETLDSIIKGYIAPHPLDVLKLIARHRGHRVEDATVVLVIDGLHRLMDTYEDAHHEESKFYRTLAAIGDLMHNGVFLLTCCTATVSGPIEGFLKTSTRKRVYLPVAALEPPSTMKNNVLRPVFAMDNPILKILVEDCGGHGRAIEVLSSLTENMNVDECDVGNLIRDLCASLVNIYWNIIDTNAAKAIVRGVFTNQRFLFNEPVSVRTLVQIFCCCCIVLRL
jgi:hypothetical protein